MQNFDYRTPTRLIFGRESIVKLPEVMRPLGKRVLLTYGGSVLDCSKAIAENEGLEHAYVPLMEQDIKEILVASL